MGKACCPTSARTLGLVLPFSMLIVLDMHSMLDKVKFGGAAMATARDTEDDDEWN